MKITINNSNKSSLLFIVLFMLFTIGLQAQNNTIRTTGYLSEIGSSGPKISDISYYWSDLKPRAKIGIGQSPLHRDIVRHIEYDNYERLNKIEAETTYNDSYGGALLITSSLVNYYADHYPSEVTDINGEFYIPSENYKYEASPINRILKRGSHGNTWKYEEGITEDHTIESKYGSNVSTDKVKKWVARTEWNSSEGIYEIDLVNAGLYSVQELSKEITLDENHEGSEKDHSLESYQNRRGQKVLNRTYESGKVHDTYYVYDVYDNLTYVFPPEASKEDEITTGVLDELCYQYRYDYRNRLVEKKLPGKEWEEMVYDRQDRLVCQRDGRLQKNEEWLLTKYDYLGRVVCTGIYKSGDTRAGIQGEVHDYDSNNEKRTVSSFSKDGIRVNYTSEAFPEDLPDYELHTVTYYDDYKFDESITVPSNIFGQMVTSSSTDVGVNSLPVATLVNVLPYDKWNKSYSFYDLKSREVQSHENNYMGGYTIENKYIDFRGKMSSDYIQHKRDGAAESIVYSNKYDYDHAERLIGQSQWSDSYGGYERINEQKYNEIGQLSQKLVGGNSATDYEPLQEVDYRYNIRGWLTDINKVEDLEETSDLFAFHINYKDALHVSELFGMGVEALYNGNISETLWRAASDGVLRGYGYNYDGLNRLKGGFYQKAESAIPLPRNYDEYKISYDKNGNIQSLIRNTGFDDPSSVIEGDDLSYAYNGNQLMSVTDGTGNPFGFDDGNEGDDYDYDESGNLTYDHNKQIEQIIYNHLNLPKSIIWNTGSTIEYTYTATGEKVKKEVRDIEAETIDVTDYLNGFQYKNEKFQFYPHTEGYAKLNDEGKIEHIYHYKDHLGNVRLSYKYDRETEQTEIIEENHYYPFGQKIEGFNEEPQESEENNYTYQFGEKEYQGELGLNWSDNSARNYDAALGRWFVLDALADAIGQVHNTPYGYAMNNPIFFNDPDGNCPPGVDCGNPLDIMRIRRNRASNTGKGMYRNSGKKFHAGHDLYSPAGSSVFSVMDGEVIAVGYSKSYGNYVTIKTTHTYSEVSGYDGREKIVEDVSKEYYTFYAHLESSSVTKNDKIKKGDSIGKVGTTGNASGLSGNDVHLHFEIGTKLRSSNVMVLKSSLLDANIAYKDVRFDAMDPNASNSRFSSLGLNKIILNSKGQRINLFRQKRLNKSQSPSSNDTCMDCGFEEFQIHKKSMQRQKGIINF